MINHVRTLLLNESQHSLMDAGFPYGVPWVVSPKFEVVDVPKRISGVRDAIFFGTSSWQSRFDRVNAVMSVLGAVDMSPFLGMFDTRSTVPETEGLSSVRGLFDKSRESSSGFEQPVIESVRGAPTLFAATGIRDVDDALPALSGLARGSFEWETRFSSIVLGYCAQLEGVRRGATGV